MDDRRHPRPGAELLASGGVRFRLWAPACQQVRVALYESTGSSASRLVDLRAVADGWHELDEPRAGVGSRYHFVLPDGQRVPDPASRFQPEDVHGPSEIVDPQAYRWNDAAWQGLPWHCAVIYELHVGTFTPEGTFEAAIARLDHLVALGVTALQLMPVADFPGRWNWGYDGVLLYAPDSTYGRPEDLKRLIDAAHARGLMVLLDVVYNHFGPDVFHGSPQDPLGRRHQLRWTAQRGGAAVRHRQRAVLAHRIPFRWPAHRRHPCALRRQ
jgi:maltooligosyltrehalose trehalohydrolase